MIPINSNLSFSSVLNLHTTPLPTSVMFDQWAEWATQAQPGVGEQRDIALQRVIECLEHGSNTLNLENLKLTVLPPALPETVTILHLSDNQLTQLPETLPPELKELGVDHNQLTQLPETLPVRLRELAVGHNQLTELPEMLPSGLEILYADHNQLTQLPETLPVRLRELAVGYNQLTHLPEILPSELESLDVDHNQLTHLPEILPSRLEILYADHNQLTQLPLALPMELRELEVSNNQITHLPEILPLEIEKLDVGNNQLIYLPSILPPELEVLNVSNNQITYLPEALPPMLDILLASNNQLTRLPSILPMDLRQLVVDGNQLTFLPEVLPYKINNLDVENNQLNSLPAVLPPDLKVLNVSNNRLTHLPMTLPFPLEVLLANHNQLTQLPQLLPRTLLVLDINSNSFDLPPRIPSFLSQMIDEGHIFVRSPKTDLIETIRLWDTNSDIERWETITDENNAEHFAHFLKTLHDKYNSSNVLLHSIVSEWLANLVKEENKDIRAQTFAIAQMGSESCVDRASYYFNQMHSLFLEHRLILDNVPIPETLNTLRSLFRLQELEKIAAAHVEERRHIESDFAEDIEIYLAYQLKLREELSLPVYTQLHFENLANLSLTDLEKAKRVILDNEKQKFLHHLVNHSEVWKKKIQAWNPQQWELANERYLDKIGSSNFQQTVKEALKKEGVSIIDEDAIRIMQQKLADDALFHMRYPLTVLFLKEHNALSFIEIDGHDRNEH